MARNLFARNLPANFLEKISHSTQQNFSSCCRTGSATANRASPATACTPNFPRYGYLDMIEADYRLLTEGLGANHARLVMGTSMGGMHTWLWGELHPDFMDALMPLASLPTQISGRNRAWRRVVIDAIRNDPLWEGGEYNAATPSLRTAAEMLWFMSSNPVLRQKDAPSLAKTDEVLDKFVEQIVKTDDANDVLDALEASHDYDPGPNLEKISAPLLAINSADDLINPPELGFLEREIKRVPKGRAILIPTTDKTRGHGSHTIASLWKGIELWSCSRKTKPIVTSLASYNPDPFGRSLLGSFENLASIPRSILCCLILAFSFLRVTSSFVRPSFSPFVATSHFGLRLERPARINLC